MAERSARVLHFTGYVLLDPRARRRICTGASRQGTPMSHQQTDEPLQRAEIRADELRQQMAQSQEPLDALTAAGLQLRCRRLVQCGYGDHEVAAALGLHVIDVRRLIAWVSPL